MKPITGLVGLFLGRPSDFTHHYDGASFGICLKGRQAVDEIGAVYRVPSDADHGALPHPEMLDLTYSFISERAGARYDANMAG
jgi:hypothetical protein